MLGYEVPSWLGSPFYTNVLWSELLLTWPSEAPLGPGPPFPAIIAPGLVTDELLPSLIFWFTFNWRLRLMLLVTEPKWF